MTEDDFKVLKSGPQGSLKWRDRGLKAIVASFTNAGTQRQKVEAGVVGAPATREVVDPRTGRVTDITMGELALIQEYGTRNGHIPSRAFMRNAVQDAGTKARTTVANQAMMLAIAALIVKKQFRLPVLEILNTLGEHLVEIIRHSIDRGEFELLAPDTVKKKGHEHPLVDSGALREAISYRIVDRAGETVGEGGGTYQVDTSVGAFDEVFGEED